MAKTKSTLKLHLRIPNLIVDARGASPKLLEAIIPALQELEAHVKILGGESAKTKKIRRAFSLEDALEEAHLWLSLAEKLPAEFPTLVERGVVPIMKEGLHPEAENYSPIQESGNGFLFEKSNVWHIHAAIVIALENFRFPYDWQNLKTNVKNFTKNIVRLK